MSGSSEEVQMSESRLRDGWQEPGHPGRDDEHGAEPPPAIAEERQPGATAGSRERLSARQVAVVIIIVLLIVGAMVAHLLTGPGVSH